jgi:hypothetical protein
MDKRTKEQLLLSELSKFGAATANEVIDNIFKRDLRKGHKVVIQKGWQFYQHLNKHFTDLEKAGLISARTKKRGPTNRWEKVWAPTSKSFKLFFKSEKTKINIKEKIKESLQRLKSKRKKR